MHNEEISTSYSSLNMLITPVFTLRRMALTEPVSRIGEVRNAHRNVVGKPAKGRVLRRFICGWEDDIKMDLNYDLRLLIWFRTETRGGLLRTRQRTSIKA
jgi:hypothetical protein